MRREIKFRCWQNNKMSILNIYECVHYPTDFVLRANNDEAWIDDTCGDLKSILMQYTGLKDKNGLDIYEGDILQQGEPMELSGCKPKQKMPTGINKVIYHEGAFKLNSTGKSRRYHLSSLSIRYSGLEVIGNIYQHPHLLKQML